MTSVITESRIVFHYVIHPSCPSELVRKVVVTAECEVLDSIFRIRKCIIGHVMAWHVWKCIIGIVMLYCFTRRGGAEVNTSLLVHEVASSYPGKYQCVFFNA